MKNATKLFCIIPPIFFREDNSSTFFIRDQEWIGSRALRKSHIVCLHYHYHSITDFEINDMDSSLTDGSIFSGVLGPGPGNFKGRSPRPRRAVCFVAWVPFPHAS